MEKTIGVIILLCLILGYFIKERLLNKNSAIEENQTKNKNIYIKRKLLTNTELTFYNYFKKLEPQYIVLPQINLASIINKKNNFRTYQNELYRNIDFCIFDQNLEVLLAIEINDDSHKTYKRKLRDKKVKEILNSCSIELLTYNVNYPNTETSVIERTLKTLENIVNKK